MYIGPFCALCGGIFKPLSRSQSPLRPDWETLTRLACGSEETDADEAPVVSGLGYYAVKSVRARMNYESIYNDTESPYDLEEHPILIPSARKRVFGFHEVCWQLLLSRLATLGQHEPDPREVGSCLFQVLKSIPWGSAGVLLPDNNYHGTVNLRQNGNGRRLLMADPTQFPDPILYHDDIGEQNKKLPQNPRYDILSALHTHNSSTKCDPFSQLPPEIVQYLIILLPSKDVCSARLSSRHLALNVYEYHLPRRFWASRFSPENEMGFALDLYLPKFRHDQIDWHKTYLDCKSHNQPRPQSRSFQNRRRIWRCVEDFAIIIDRLLQSRQHSQCQILPKDSMVLDPATCSMGPRAVCPRLPATFHYEDNGPLHSGVRLCEFRVFPLQRDADSDTLILQICTTSLSSGVYISGLRALIQPHGSRAHVVQQAGMIVASSLHSMRLLPGDTLTSIDVTISSSGLHGLKFFITKLDGSISKEIFGNINISGNTMAVTKLQSQGGITALIVGFDIWKAGSIQIIELAMTDNFYGVRNKLWNRLRNPTFPPLEMDHPSSSRYINEISNGCQFPVEIYMPFGAQNGSRLASLCGVTAFLYGTFGFFGLQFAYADGTKTLYGRTASVLDGGRVQACVEQNFLIRGPKGERITHLVASGKVGGSDGRQVIQDIEVWTNFGRHYYFGAEGGHRLDRKRRERSSQPLPNSEVTNSLVMLTSSPLWAFESVKAQTIVLGEHDLVRNDLTLTPTDVNLVPQKVLDAGSWVLDGEGACVTIASLKHVRRIRFMTGAVDRSRTKDHISGLHIEYYDGHEDALVGQGITESACMILEKGESIVEVFFWATMEKAITMALRHFGRVTGLGFLTSTKRRFELRLTALVENTYTRYRATPYESLQNLTWSYNFSMDDVQVHLEATDMLGEGYLLFGHSGVEPHPLDIANGVTRSHFSFASLTIQELKYEHDPRQESAMRYHYFRQPFFFHEVDEDENIAPLQSIRLTVDSNNRLTGIEFRYARNIKVCHGTTQGTPHILNLEDDEHISKLYVHEKHPGSRTLPQNVRLHEDSVNLGLELHTSKSRRFAAGVDAGDSKRSRSFALIPSIEPGIGKTAELIGENNISYGFPESKNGKNIRNAVGIWATTRLQRIQVGQDSAYEVLDVGPIYLEE